MNPKQKILDCVRANPGRSTTEIAEITGLATSDSNDRHKDWDVYGLLKELESEGRIIDIRKNKNRGVPCEWYFVK